MPLRPHQVAPADELEKILRSGLNAVDLSSMGVGKTFVAAAIIARLNLPTLVVAPKISVSAWLEAIRGSGGAATVTNYEKLRTGNHPAGWWDNQREENLEVFWKCVNCQRRYSNADQIDRCYCRHDGIHCFETKKTPHRYGRFHFHPGVSFVVFDEVHRCGGIGSLNEEMLVASTRERKKVLGLSATAGVSPLSFRGLGYVLGLHNYTDFYNWASRLGCKRIPGAGFVWMKSEAEQKLIMSGIRDKIIPSCGVRVTAESIPDFPECDITAELYDLKEAGRIEKLYAEMAVALAALKDKSLMDKDAEHPLTKRLRNREEIELLKVPLAEELARDSLAKGYSVALFFNFTSALNEMAKRLKTDCIVDGSPSGVKNRDSNVNRFQTNDSRLILINSKAGSVHLSLHDLDGDHARVGYVMPGESAVEMRQVFGRLRRHGGKSKCFYRVVLARGTCEIKIHRAISLKHNNLDSLNDGDLRPELDS